MHRRLASLALLIVLAVSFAPATAQATPNSQVQCESSFGFRALHDLIPQIVGECFAGTYDIPSNGAVRFTTGDLEIYVDYADLAQITTNGVLLWRATDAWTAFTDGTTTWVNGPCGLQSRPNDTRYSWEIGGGCDGAPPVSVVAPPLAPETRQWPQVEEQIFALINQQRLEAGVQPVVWDQHAADVALRHAQEMAQSGYLSHWNQAGEFPQQRYGQVGGRAYAVQNVSCQWRTWSGDPPSPRPPFSEQAVAEAVFTQQMNMIGETPPADGHRRNILDPNRTAVGLAIASGDDWICMDQEFLNQYMSLEGIPNQPLVGEPLHLSGVAAPGYEVFAVQLGYLPPGLPMTIEELHLAPLQYGNAPVYRQLSPQLGPDGSFSLDVAFDLPSSAVDPFSGALLEGLGTDGAFLASASGPPRAGRYQVTVWVRAPDGIVLPAANPMFEVRDTPALAAP